jgi:hypothetical protein
LSERDVSRIFFAERRNDFRFCGAALKPHDALSRVLQLAQTVYPAGQHRIARLSTKVSLILKPLNWRYQSRSPIHTKVRIPAIAQTLQRFRLVDINGVDVRSRNDANARRETRIEADNCRQTLALAPELRAMAKTAILVLTDGSTSE